jgi:hypothetical protein
MADHAAAATRQYRAELPSAGDRYGVSDEVHAAVERVEACGSKSSIDRIPGEPDAKKLRAGDEAALAICELRDLAVV